MDLTTKKDRDYKLCYITIACLFGDGRGVNGEWSTLVHLRTRCNTATCVTTKMTYKRHSFTMRRYVLFIPLTSPYGLRPKLFD